MATSVAYRRAIGELAELLGCEPEEEAVFARRLELEPGAYASLLLQATETDVLLIDDGFPAGEEAFSWQRMGELARCTVMPVLRLETTKRAAEEVRDARERGFAALKTIAAYRGGLQLDESHPVWAALEANEAMGRPLPVQVHCGFGDASLWLPLADPGWLKPAIERFDLTPFVLLHCYPFVREAGWLAHVYPNVFFDLSLTIPFVARPEEAVREALELAPWSKLLYASDASSAPELYFVAASRWRRALAVVLPELLHEADAVAAAHAILRENALRIYPI